MKSDGRGTLLAVLASLVAITVATNTTASLAQPAIGSTFSVGPADTGWVVFGYSATFAVGTALWGGIASRIGILRALTLGVALLGVGSVAGAVAPTLEILVGSRLVQGLGSGAIPTLATALIAGRFDGPDRARAIGVIVASVGAGQALGPLVGGVLLDLIGWRAAVSIGILTLPAVILLVRSQRGRAATVAGGRRIDWLGAAVMAVLTISIIVVLNRGPLLGVTAVTVVPALAAVVAGLVLWRRSVADSDAFVPRDVIGDPTFRQVVPLGAIGMAAYLGSIVLVPIFGARVLGFEGTALGLLVLPMAIAAAIVSPNNVRVSDRIGAAATTRLALALLGFACLVVGLGAPSIGVPALLVGLAMIGTGFGLLNAPLLSRLTHAVEGDRQPVAVGLYNLTFFFGGALGGAIASALVQAGIDLPGIGSAALPGFVTAHLLLAVGPLLAAARTRPVVEPAAHPVAGPAA